MKEVWKDIEGYEGYYQISNFGNIKSLDRYVGNGAGVRFLASQPIKTRIGKDKCVKVSLNKEYIKTTYYVARLIYKAFNPNFDISNEHILISYKDNDSTNIKLNNLFISEEQSIKTPPPYPKKSIKCITTNKKFNSITEASVYYKIDRSSIVSCCNKKCKSAGKIILDDGTIYKLEWEFDKDSIEE